MTYLNVIKDAVIFFPLIALLITIPFILYNYHKYGSIYYFRTFIVYFFILFLLIIYFLVILPLPDKDSISLERKPQLIPFNFICDFITKSGFNLLDLSSYHAFKTSYFYVPVFNILMFIPLGMYLRYYFNYNLKKIIIFSFLLSLFFELTQLSGLYFIYPSNYRLFDVDDLMLNVSGSIVGYYLFNLLKNILPSKDKINLETIKRRDKITILKRFTLFCLDLFILTLITSFINIDIIISASIYYIVIPLILNNQTLGGKFLNIALFSKNNKDVKYQLILREALFVLVYFVIPKLNLLNIIFFMFNFLYFFIKKEFIYEKISQTKLKSTF